MKLTYSKANAKTQKLMTVAALQPFLSGGRKVYSLDLPSGVTCPGAKDCHSWAKVDPQTGKAHIVDGPNCQFRCFSASTEVQYTAVRELRYRNYAAIKDACIHGNVANLIIGCLPTNAGIIRYHVGGDFYSRTYLEGAVAAAKIRPDVLFYFYTKSLDHLKAVVAKEPTANLLFGRILPNMRVTGSVGGKYDNMLTELGLRQAKVVYSEVDASTAGLQIDKDDSHAACEGGSFALLIHGTQPKGSTASKALSILNGTGSYSRK
jgi:Gene product 88